ncbi:MAG: phosphotransferase, partial [Rhodospirillaceae bacterium]|nr:phosphotransferase [Rhodospirillaceae bacterium]
VQPAEGLPMGALAVERIDGPKPSLPRDLPAIAKCLARLHGLPVPEAAARAPLLVNVDPIGETLRAVREQATFLREAGLRPMAAAAVSAELARAEGLTATARPPALLTLIGSDTHPGNFLLPRRRHAVFVDLEKAQYGNPAIDLAHATLYTSTMWDPDCATRLSAGDVADFHAAYFAAVPRAFAERLKPWIAPMRRLIWLRTTTWCIRWRVLSRREDGWSKARLSPDHAAHIDRTVEDYVDPERIAAIRETLDADEERFSS